MSQKPIPREASSLNFAGWKLTAQLLTVTRPARVCASPAASPPALGDFFISDGTITATTATMPTARVREKGPIEPL